LVVTYECNLACAYCHEYTHGAPLVPFEVLARRIDALGELGAFAFDVLGGEPLLHPDIVRLIARIKATRRRVNFATIITNAFKLTPELVDGFNEAGLDCMQVSVDTIDPEPDLPKSLRSVLPKLGILASRAKFQVKIQTVLTRRQLAALRGVPRAAGTLRLRVRVLLVARRGRRIAIPGRAFRRAAAPARALSGMAFFRRHAAEMLVGDFRRPWKCLAASNTSTSTRTDARSIAVRWPGRRPIESLTLADLRAADVHKPCEAGCALGCVRTVSHAMANPLASARDLGRDPRRLHATPGPATVPIERPSPR